MTSRLGVIAFALFVSACTGAPTPSPTPAPSATPASSIVGTYLCGPPEARDQDKVEVRADGTVTITQPGGEPGQGTWSVQGNRGFFNPGTSEEDPFTIDGDRLVFDDGFVCNPAS